MEQIKLDFNTALLPMFMVREAVRSVLVKEGQVGLEQLHFTSVEIIQGLAEPQKGITRNQAGAALLREKPHLEIVQTILVNGDMSIFNGSVFTVKAQCVLYRHLYSHHDLCHPESIALTVCNSEGDDGPEEHTFRFKSWYDAARIRHMVIEPESTLTKKDKLKLALISTDVLPDHYVEKLVLDFEVTSVEDLDEIIGCMSKHRPVLAKRLLSVTEK